MRFDNPIYNHKLKNMLDIASFQEVADEYKQKKNISLTKLYQHVKTGNIKKFNLELNKIISLSFKENKRTKKEIELEKKWREKLNRYFNFYKNFKVKSKKINNKIFKDLYNKGYSFQFIDSNVIDFLKKSLSKKIKHLSEKNDWRPPTGIYDRFALLDEFYINYLNQAYTENGIIEAASAYYNKKMKVSRVSLLVKKKTDNSPKQFLYDCKKLPKHTNLHFDPLEGAIKTILYLNDVKEDNGPTGYLPYSNRFMYNPLQNLFGRAISTGSYCQEKESRASIFRLPKKLRVSSNFGRMVKDGSVLQKYFSKNIDVLTSNKGNVMIFDSNGIHNGPIVKRKYRISLDVVML